MENDKIEHLFNGNEENTTVKSRYTELAVQEQKFGIHYIKFYMMIGISRFF